jgi:hypothetical protein
VLRASLYPSGPHSSLRLASVRARVTAVPNPSKPFVCMPSRQPAAGSRAPIDRSSLTNFLNCCMVPYAAAACMHPARATAALLWPELATVARHPPAGETTKRRQSSCSHDDVQHESAPRDENSSIMVPARRCCLLRVSQSAAAGATRVCDDDGRRPAAAFKWVQLDCPPPVRSSETSA